MSTEVSAPCWEITRCGRTEDCLARREPDRPCWEIASSLDDYRASLNVCADCIVYIAKHENPVLPAGELQKILAEKGVCVVVAGCPLAGSRKAEK